MATREAINDLKRNWVNDPCYDIECVDGFDEHREELIEFRKAQEAIWERNRRRASIETCRLQAAGEWESPERERARRLMLHYFAMAIGDRLDPDCRAEIGTMVDSMIEAAKDELRAEIEAKRELATQQRKD